MAGGRRHRTGRGGGRRRGRAVGRARAPGPGGDQWVPVADPGRRRGGHRSRAALFDEVVGQPRAVAQLMAAARRPVHAYLLHGPPGSGKRAAARGLAAALLCPDGGCGSCNVCRRALAGTHPDLVVVERTGASLGVDDARSIVTRAQRRPLEAARQVLMVTDVHLAAVAGARPAQDGGGAATVDCLRAPGRRPASELSHHREPVRAGSLRSRCPPVGDRWLVDRGVDAGAGRFGGRAVGGSLDRARLLVSDPGFVDRQAVAIGARPVGRDRARRLAAAGELLAVAEEALAPLREQHAANWPHWRTRPRPWGQGHPRAQAGGGPPRREERRWRTDDLRFGLAALAEVYRDRLVAAAGGERGVRSSGRRGRGHGGPCARRGDRGGVGGARAQRQRMAADGALMVELSGMID